MQQQLVDFESSLCNSGNKCADEAAAAAAVLSVVDSRTVWCSCMGT